MPGGERRASRCAFLGLANPIIDAALIRPWPSKKPLHPYPAGPILRAIPHNPGLKTTILKNSDEVTVNPVAIGLIVSVFVFGGAMLGVYLRAALPEDHFNSEAREAVK